MKEELTFYREDKQVIKNTLFKYGRIAILGAKKIEALKLVLDIDVEIEEIPKAKKVDYSWEDNFKRALTYGICTMYSRPISKEYKKWDMPIHWITLKTD